MAATDPITQEDINAAARDPKAMQGEQGSWTSRDISELKEAQQGAAANTAASKGHRGIRFTKLIPSNGDGD